MLHWYLIRKSILEESRFKSYNQQEKLLKDNENRPKAIEVAYITLLYYAVKGVRLFEHDEVWCCDNAERHRKVWVGRFDRGGLVVLGSKPDELSENLGLAPIRKRDFDY